MRIYPYDLAGGSVDLTDSIVDPGMLVRNQFITQTLETGSLNTVFLDTALAVDPTRNCGLASMHVD